MKSFQLFVFLLIFSFFSAPCVAQGQNETTIKVLDGKGKPVSGAVVTLTETTTADEISRKTDAIGVAVFSVTHGKEWAVAVNGFAFKNRVDVPEQGTHRQGMTLTYNPAVAGRWKEQVNDRSNLEQKEVTITADRAPDKGFALVKVLVVSTQGEKQKGKKVVAVCLQAKRAYLATTDGMGIARFLLPVMAKYDIDVEEKINADYIDLDRREGIIATVTVDYEATNIRENRQGDTIVQVLPALVGPTSSRAVYTIRVQHTGAGEPVFLEEIHGKDIYRAITDKSGAVTFLLPLGKKYMLHFNFQRDVDVVDLTQRRGMVEGSMEVRYLPDPRLEHPELFIPKREELFLVEFDNFLKQQFPKPVSPNNTGIFLQWGNSKVNGQSKEAVLELGITTASAPNPNSPPVNISFVLDRSGSMAGYYRIEKLKESFAAFIDKMRPDDIVSIVMYDDRMELLLPAQRIGKDKQRIRELIGSIQPGGSTNMLEAMRTGYEQVLAHYIPGGNNRVVLLTDGYDNNEVDVLLKAQQPYNAKGIACTAVGVGADYNYALLKQLATNGGGILHFAGESGDMDRIFNQELAALLSPVGKDVQLEIVYNSKIVFRQLYGYEPVKNTGSMATVQLPHLYPGMNKVALVHFDLKAPDASIENFPVVIRIRYFDLVKNRQEIMEEKAYLKWEPATGQHELIREQEQKKLYCIAVINQSLKVMAEAYSAGDNRKAQETLERCRLQVTALYPQATDTDVKKLLESIDQYLEAFKNLGRKNKIQGEKDKPQKSK